MDIPENRDQSTDPVEPRRLFLYEGGWRVGLKVGSEREFCYMTKPGQDFYHRLLDGEIYLVRGDEKLCLACAERRGLLSYEPRILGKTVQVPEFDPRPMGDREPKEWL